MTTGEMLDKLVSLDMPFSISLSRDHDPDTGRKYWWCDFIGREFDADTLDELLVTMCSMANAVAGEG